MGIIKAIAGAVSGNLADQWLEVLEADNMTDTTVCAKGVTVRRNDRRFGNKKGTEDIVSNGSIIHVYPNQFMMLLDGGKVVDYTAEEGYYKVSNSSSPSLFNGQFGASLSDAFSRVKFSGVPSQKQKVIYINLQEIKGIKFGTPNPVNYFDNFYNAELFLRAHGTYSIKIVDPIKFYAEAIAKNADHVDIKQINEQYLSEFLEALQAAINQMSADGVRVSQVVSKGRDLSRYMQNILDEDWNKMRGMEIQAVGIASISYDEESKKLINMRNQGAMLGDATVREGYMQGAMARGFEAAGHNSNGAGMAFMGMGVGMNAGGAMFGNMSANNQELIRQQQEREAAAKKAAEEKAAAEKAAAANSWTCACGATNTGKFCAECGAPKPAPKGTWTCACGAVNTGKFCSECGAPAPKADDGKWICPECGKENTGKFCADCGTKRP
ncbi:MAG: SPFH domain-containing protein [Clostridia bacterium]|nr:SPFH domain-containing protein [Clostridia bacterium]